MRRHLVTALLLALCAVGIAATQRQQRPEKPPLEASNGTNLEIPVFVPYASDRPGEPAWARGSYFEDQFGGLDKTRLEWHYGTSFYEILNALHQEALAAFNNGTEPPDCMNWGAPSSQGHHDPTFPDPPSSVQQMVDRAALVATGTVSAIETGFFGVAGGSMLLVRLDDFASLDGYEQRREMLVLWPSGEVRIGRATLCAFMDGFPPAPSVGDKIVVFPQYELYAAEEPWVDVNGHASGGAAAYANAGGLVVPGPLSRAVPNVARARSFRTLTGSVDAAVSRSALR